MPANIDTELLYKIIVAMIVLVLAVSLIRHTMKAVSWCFGLLVLCQIGFVLSHTVLVESLPFLSFFEYDVMSAVGHLFPGTFIETGLCTVANFINKIFSDFAGVIKDLWDASGLEHFFRSVGDGFKEVYKDVLP